MAVEDVVRAEWLVAAAPAAITFGSGLVTAAVVRAVDPDTLAAAVFSLSKSDVVGLDRVEAEAYVVACERVTAAIDARQSLAMETMADRVDHDQERRRV